MKINEDKLRGLVGVSSSWGSGAKPSGCGNAQYGPCNTYCQVNCQNNEGCGSCEKGCQSSNCQYACEYGGECGSCEKGCQNCQTACESDCQTYRETCGSCQYGGECGSCQSGCQDCQTTCESSCQTACQKSAQNAAPYTPGAIRVPASAKVGDNVSVSWDKSTDRDGNLSGYVLERKVDSGSFSQIYKGSNTSYSDNIKDGWKAVTYRVKAYDTQNAHSGYKTSSEISILQNAAPIFGDSDRNLGEKQKPFELEYTVSDSDGDKFTIIERVNGKAIKTVTNAGNGSRTLVISDGVFNSLPFDSIIKIELEATDTKGNKAYRRYVFTRTNSAPEVTTSGDLGQKTSPFSVSFTAKDAENDSMSASLEFLNKEIGKVGSVTPSRTTSINLGKVAFARAKNGENYLYLNVRDAKGANTRKPIKFVKALDKMWYTFKQVTDKKASYIVVSPKWKIAKGAIKSIEVCNNANDSSPKWESAKEGEPHQFTNNSKTASSWALGVRIVVKKGTATEISTFSGFGGAYK